MQDLKLVRLLQQKEEAALTKLGEKYQKGFTAWAGGLYHFKREEIQDFFVDALLDFYENVLAGKFQISETKAPENKVKNYLFTLFKNKLVNEVIKVKRRKELQEEVENASESWLANEDIEQDVFNQEKIAVIANCMKILGESCRQLLHLFYFERMSLKEIAEKLNYKNDKTAKAKRHQCFQKLKKIVQERFDKNDF